MGWNGVKGGRGVEELPKSPKLPKVTIENQITEVARNSNGSPTSKSKK